MLVLSHPKLSDSYYSQTLGDKNERRVEKRNISVGAIGKSDAFRIHNLNQLSIEVAKLSNVNPRLSLFYRGQARDYLDKNGCSTFLPGLFREPFCLNSELCRNELDRLSDMLNGVCKSHGVKDFGDLKKREYSRWSLLQHYEVCPTPLLDLTQSIRVACGFAFDGWNEGDDGPYVFVFGFPNPVGRMSLHCDDEIINIRLLGTLPSVALRPYLQEGYLACSEETDNIYPEKYDFKLRLLAKFNLGGSYGQWSQCGLPTHEMLYPPEDKLLPIAEDLINERAQELSDLME